MAILTKWKIAIPKEAILRLVEAMDADRDGYLEIGEIKDLLVRYAKDVKASIKYPRR